MLSAAVLEGRCRVCRLGFVVDRPTAAELQGAEADLTVTPIVPRPYGPVAEPFAVYARTQRGSLVLPRFYGVHAYLGGAADVTTPLVPVSLGEGDDLRAEVVLADTVALDPAKRQVEAVAALTAALVQPRTLGGGVLSLAVGMGKTVVAIYVAVAVVRKKTLIVVHTSSLLNQWRERVAQFAPSARVGVVQGPRAEVEDVDVVVAMLQSLAMRGDAAYPATLFDSFGLVIFDEVHLVPTRTFSRALRRVGSCRRIVGLSATPVRKDGLSCVIDHFIGGVVFAADRDRLTMRVTVRLIDSGVGSSLVERPARYGRRGVDYVAMIGDLVADRQRNALIADHCVALRGKRVLVLSERRSHLRTLLAEISRRAGESCAGLYIGGMSEAELADSAGRDVVLGTYSIASVGLDIQGLNVLLLATPRTDVVQATGRIMRDENPEKIVVDIVDRYSGVFVSQMRRRRRFYAQMGYAVESVVGPVEAVPVRRFGDSVMIVAEDA